MNYFKLTDSLEKKRWTNLCSLHTVLSGHTCDFYCGKLYIFGGRRDKNTYFQDFIVLDFSEYCPIILFIKLGFV